MKSFCFRPLLGLFALAFLPALVAVEPPVSWETARQIEARIIAPTFPARDFSILDYGAVEGGAQDATSAIRQAISACHAAGGGRVIVPAGVFLTGAIHLQSNVNLHLADGATLRFSTDPKAYLPVVFTRWEGIECMNFSALIYAFEQENIAVTGKGILDGQAAYENWWGWKTESTVSKKNLSHASTLVLNKMSDEARPVAERIFGEGHFLRPNFFQPYRCKNVLISDVTFLRSPMWEVHPVLCQNVTVRGLTIKTHGPNNDGCDPESCRDVLIENTLFDTGDDCIAIKAGRNDDGRRVGVPSENIIIRNCDMKDGHGGVVIGSEIAGGCRNVFVENCRMDSVNLERGLRFKSNARRGGLVENVFMRDVTIGKVLEAVVTVDFLYEEGANGKHMPTVRNVYLENVTSSASPRVFFARGFEGATIDNLNLKNCTFTGVDATDVLEHVGHITYDKVTIKPAKKLRSLNSRPAGEL